MLELFAIFYLSRKLSRIAQDKGRGRGWGAMGAGMWIGGEMIGAIVGVATGEEAMIYICALVGAVIGGGTAWVIVNSLSAVEGYPMNVGMPYAVPHSPGAYDPSNPYSPGAPPSAYGGYPQAGPPAGYGGYPPAQPPHGAYPPVGGQPSAPQPPGPSQWNP